MNSDIAPWNRHTYSPVHPAHSMQRRNSGVEGKMMCTWYLQIISSRTFLFDFTEIDLESSQCYGKHGQWQNSKCADPERHKPEKSNRRSVWFRCAQVRAGVHTPPLHPAPAERRLLHLELAHLYSSWVGHTPIPSWQYECSIQTRKLELKCGWWRGEGLHRQDVHWFSFEFLLLVMKNCLTKSKGVHI